MESDRYNIFLEKNRGVSYTNKNSSVNIDLKGKFRMLPDESLSDTLSLYGQYNAERDNCNLFRLIFTVNPVCSNVLYNMKTEVVVKEGSENCSVIRDPNMPLSKGDYAADAINATESITHLQAIRDTEYSHKLNGGFVYHCGVDIFNNHLLRSQNFVHVNKVGKASSITEMLAYNTISDFLRNGDGNIVTNRMDTSYSGNDSTNLHLYGTDSLLTLKKAYYDRCEEKDGWWGFYNKGNINIYTSSSKTISVNNVLNDNKPCEFIDLYPDRSLFSFIPKYNKYRNRIEKNWDYCITYPYKADEKAINRVCGGKSQEIKATTKVVYKNNIPLLQCTSYFKHSFKVGDYVNFYYYEEEDDIPQEGQQTGSTRAYMKVKRMYKYNKQVRIESIGDANGDFSDRIFSVRYEDVDNVVGLFEENGCYYKKVVNGTECSYYFRKFKKIKNSNGEELTSDVNKLAFGVNIYGDDVAQIVFTDDINVESLVDENGRPITEVFLTIVKRNKGHNEWYSNVRPNVSSPEIEFSHCFGKLTSGIDFSGVDIEDEPFDYNIHYLHNVKKDETLISSDESYRNTLSALGATILNGMPKKIEDDITIDFDEFYGDIVEFDNYNYERNIIGHVYHRFNTEQRETTNVAFMDLYQDIIIYDDYDKYNGYRDGGGGFEVATYYLNDYLRSDHRIDETTEENTLVRGNIMPEGYFYNPHTSVLIRQEDSNVMRTEAKHINYSDFTLSGRTVYLEFEISMVNGERVYTLVGKRYENPWENGNGFGGRGNETPSRSSTPENPNGNVTAHVFCATTEGYLLSVIAPTEYKFVKSDYVALYDNQTGNVIWGEIMAYNRNILTVFFDENAFGEANVLSHKGYFMPDGLNRRYYMFWSPNSVPLYAKLCVETLMFTWKRIIPQSELSSESELFDMTFSNGRLYKHENVNLFVRRQDPHGEYGLGEPITIGIDKPIPHPMTKFSVMGERRPRIDIVADINKMTTCY